MHLVEVEGQPVRVADVAPNEMPLDPLLAEVVGRGHQGFLVEVRADEHERVRVEVLAAEGLGGDELAQVQQQGAVSAAHVAQAQGLLVEGRIKDALHHVVEVIEIRLVGAPGTPNVQRPVHVDLGLAGFSSPEPLAVAEQKLFRPEEGLGVRGGDAVGRRALQKEAADVRAAPPERLADFAPSFLKLRVQPSQRHADVVPRRHGLRAEGGADQDHPRGGQGPFDVSQQARFEARPWLDPVPCTLEVTQGVNELSHGAEGLGGERGLGVIPHAHRQLKPRPRYAVNVPMVGPVRHVRVLAGHVRHAVLATVRVHDALRAKHAQSHVQVPWVRPKQRRQIVHVPPRLQHFLQHPTHVEHRHDPAEGQPVEVEKQARTPLALLVFGSGSESGHVVRCREMFRRGRVSLSSCVASRPCEG